MEVFNKTVIFIIDSLFIGFSYFKYFVAWVFGTVVASIMEQFIFPKWDIKVNGSRPWDIQILDKRFYPSIIAFGGIGLCESFQKSWCSTKDLEEFLHRFIKNGGLETYFNNPIVKIEQYLRWELFNRNSSSNTANTANKQFDLGKDFFESFLGETLTYSVAHWENAKNLNEAVYNNMVLLSKKLDVRPGLKVLDVGCGYGTLARHMAELHEVDVVGITNSKEMGQDAKELCKGLTVQIEIKDWRQIKGTFDRIVIVQTIEYVRAKNYRQFFQKMYDSLADGGILVIQNFGIHNKKFPRNDSFLEKYLPNAQTPRMQEIINASDGLFIIEDMKNMKGNAVKTYRAYLSNFEKEIPQLSEKYGEELCQRWSFWLTFVHASFRARYINLYQTVFSKC